MSYWAGSKDFQTQDIYPQRTLAELAQLHEEKKTDPLKPLGQYPRAHRSPCLPAYSKTRESLCQPLGQNTRADRNLSPVVAAGAGELMQKRPLLVLGPEPKDQERLFEFLTAPPGGRSGEQRRSHR
jgi:hypothetical protein